MKTAYMLLTKKKKLKTAKQNIWNKLEYKSKDAGTVIFRSLIMCEL